MIWHRQARHLLRRSIIVGGGTGIIVATIVGITAPIGGAISGAGSIAITIEGTIATDTIAGTIGANAKRPV
jgi:hypothetical protein